MEIKIKETFKNAKKYLDIAKNENHELKKLWQEYMIEPFWSEIAEWAPFDQSFKQPSYIKELEALEEQLPKLLELNLDGLQHEFEKVTEALPSVDDDPMLVALYPLCDSNKVVKERQNGVVGASVFGNMIISINPLAESYDKWIPYVFAHEYHHNLWGHHWYVVQGGKGLEGTFLETMIIEGQADLFAMSLFPDLEPQWNQSFDKEIEKVLWDRVKIILNSTDSETHEKYMFGSEKENLPWCMGYSFGQIIVEDYMKKHPNVSFSNLVEIPAKQIFEASRFSRY